MTVDFPMDWLGKAVTVGELEATQSGLAMSPDWLKLKAMMQPDDHVHEFCSSPESWKHLAGRSGLALVRDGTVVESMILLMN